MQWDIDYMSRDDFKQHVRNTIDHYGAKLRSYDLKKFNANIVDPIKMVFDRAVYGEGWKTIISNEIFRQRDKSNTNEIGYFHQRMFAYLPNCEVPENGQNGWDVVYRPPSGYVLDNGNRVSRVFVELKNKHNTMNSSSSAKTYMRMQNQLLDDDDCVCFLVEAIAKASQNIVWTTMLDGQKVSHSRIRRVSMDRFYTIVTGQELAFYRMCMVLPEIVQEVINERESRLAIPKDKVYTQLLNIADGFGKNTRSVGMLLAMYMLGFRSYSGFSGLAEGNSLLSGEEEE